MQSLSTINSSLKMQLGNIHYQRSHHLDTRMSRFSKERDCIKYVLIAMGIKEIIESQNFKRPKSLRPVIFKPGRKQLGELFKNKDVLVSCQVYQIRFLVVFLIVQIFKSSPCDSDVNDKYFGSTKPSYPLQALIPLMVLYQIIQQTLGDMEVNKSEFINLPIYKSSDF